MPTQGDLLVQIVDDPAFPVPDTKGRGKFSVERSCLVLTTDHGVRFAPVLPADARSAGQVGRRTILTIGGKQIELDRFYTLSGGEGQYRSPPAKACPQKQFLIGGVE